MSQLTYLVISRGADLLGVEESFVRLRGKVGLHAGSSLISSPGHLRGGLFSSEKLVRLKQFALRRRVWFRALSRLERGVLGLTVKYVNNVKSALLAKVLTAIMEKLQRVAKSSYLSAYWL